MVILVILTLKVMTVIPSMCYLPPPYNYSPRTFVRWQLQENTQLLTNVHKIPPVNKQYQVFYGSRHGLQVMMNMYEKFSRIENPILGTRISVLLRPSPP